jgi:hypothetical protein
MYIHKDMCIVNTLNWQERGVLVVYINPWYIQTHPPERIQKFQTQQGAPKTAAGIKIVVFPGSCYAIFLQTTSRYI